MKRSMHLSIASVFAVFLLLAATVAHAQLAFEAAVGGSCHGIDSNYPPNAAIVPPLGRCLMTWNLPALLNIAYAVNAPAGTISQITEDPIG